MEMIDHRGTSPGRAWKNVRLPMLGNPKRQWMWLQLRCVVAILNPLRAVGDYSPACAASRKGQR